MVEIKINNQNIIYKFGEWICSDSATLELVTAQAKLFDYEPSDYHPDPELARAEYVARELKGRIVKHKREFEPEELDPEVVY